MVPELVAHRGYAARYPENTLAALAAAIDVGARHVEVDVQLSADGHAVLFHDRTLTRLCGVPGAVHERTLQELAALGCGERARFGERFASEPILTLPGFAELLARHPRVHAFVEVKRAALARFGAQPVLERVLADLDGLAGRFALISFDLPFLLAARRSCAVPLGAVFDRWEERERPAVAEIAPEFLFVDLDGLPTAGSIAHPGTRVAVYEVADPALARELGARGADFVETFEIGAMLAALGTPAP
ncbi:MAG: glycerophosphodiester phosphodiesterase [Planctomycetes bacterium]|nr:glycerophosphodiester phosphodiesterase [Planctomycetota bacterium]